MSDMCNRFWLFVALCVTLMVSACGGGDASTTSNGAVVSVLSQAVDNTSGGLLTVGDKSSPLNGTQVYFPPNVLEGTSESITVSWQDGLPSPLPHEVLSDGSRVVQKTLILNRTGTNSFPTPVTITIPINVADLQGRVPTVLYWDEDLKVYERMEVVNIDRVNGFISFHTAHFSIFTFITTAIESLLPSVDTGFRPELNGFAQPNISTYDNPGYVCYGLVSFAKWYFRTQKTPALSSNYLESDLLANIDDSIAREIMQEAFGLANSKSSGKFYNSFGSQSLIDNDGIIDIRAGTTRWGEIYTYFALNNAGVVNYEFEQAAQLKKALAFGPQIIDIIAAPVSINGGTKTLGHSLLVYAYSTNFDGASVFKFYDPNFPKQTFEFKWSKSGGFDLSQYLKDANYSIQYKHVWIHSEQSSYSGKDMNKLFNDAQSKSLNQFDISYIESANKIDANNAYCILNTSSQVCFIKFGLKVDNATLYGLNKMIYLPTNLEPTWIAYYKSLNSSLVPSSISTFVKDESWAITFETAAIGLSNLSEGAKFDLSMVVNTNSNLTELDDGRYENYRAYKKVNITVAPLMVEYVKTNNVDEYTLTAKVKGATVPVNGLIRWNYGDGSPDCYSPQSNCNVHKFLHLPSTVTATAILNVSAFSSADPFAQVTIDAQNVPPTTARPMVMEFAGKDLHNQIYGGTNLIGGINLIGNVDPCVYQIGEMFATISPLGSISLAPKCVDFNISNNKSVNYTFFHNVKNTDLVNDIIFTASKIDQNNYMQGFEVRENFSGIPSPRIRVYNSFNTLTVAPYNDLFLFISESSILTLDRLARSLTFYGGNFTCTLHTGVGSTTDNVVYGTTYQNANVQLQGDNIVISAAGFNHSINASLLLNKIDTVYSEQEYYDKYRSLEVIASNKESYYVKDTFDLTTVPSPQREVFIVTKQSDGTYRGSDCYGAGIPW